MNDAHIGQWKEDKMEKSKLKVPKDYSEICQHCLQSFGHHAGFNCQGGGLWVAPKPKTEEKEYIAPKAMSDPQKLDNDLAVVETVLKAIMQTDMTKSLSLISVIAAIRHVTYMPLKDAGELADKWGKKHGWWKAKSEPSYWNALPIDWAGLSKNLTASQKAVETALFGKG